VTVQLLILLVIMPDVDYVGDNAALGYIDYNASY
jgi:hypothetical protein